MSGVPKYRSPSVGASGWAGLGASIMQGRADQARMEYEMGERTRDEQASVGVGDTAKAKYVRQKREREDEKYNQGQSDRKRGEYERSAKVFAQIGSAIHQNPENRELHASAAHFFNTDPSAQEAIRRVNPDRTGKIRFDYLDDGRVSPHVELDDGTWKPWSAQGGTDDPAVVGDIRGLMKEAGVLYVPHGNTNPFDRDAKIATARRAATEAGTKTVGSLADDFAESYVSQLPQGYWTDSKASTGNKAKEFSSDVRRTFANSPRARKLLSIKGNPAPDQMAIFMDLVAATRKNDARYKDTWGPGGKEAVNTRGTVDISKTLAKMISAQENIPEIDGKKITPVAVSAAKKRMNPEAPESVTDQEVADRFLKELGMK
jgi:hypothetical protein